MSELRKHKTYKMLTTTTSMRRTDWATDTTPLSRKRDALRVPFLYHQPFREKYIFPYFSFFALKNPKNVLKIVNPLRGTEATSAHGRVKTISLFQEEREFFQSPSQFSPLSAYRVPLHSGIAHENREGSHRGLFRLNIESAHTPAYYRCISLSNSSAVISPAFGLTSHSHQLSSCGIYVLRRHGDKFFRMERRGRSRAATRRRARRASPPSRTGKNSRPFMGRLFFCCCVSLRGMLYFWCVCQSGEKYIISRRV